MHSGMGMSGIAHGDSRHYFFRRYVLGRQEKAFCGAYGDMIVKLLEFPGRLIPRVDA